MDLVKYEELTEAVNNKRFIDLLNKVWVGNIDDDVIEVIEVKFVLESYENYPKDALHMHAENEHVLKINGTVYLVTFKQ